MTSSPELAITLGELFVLKFLLIKGYPFSPCEPVAPDRTSPELMSIPNQEDRRRLLHLLANPRSTQPVYKPTLALSSGNCFSLLLSSSCFYYNEERKFYARTQKNLRCVSKESKMKPFSN
jgi:hypothetical protein